MNISGPIFVRLLEEYNQTAQVKIQIEKAMTQALTPNQISDLWEGKGDTVRGYVNIFIQLMKPDPTAPSKHDFRYFDVLVKFTILKANKLVGRKHYSEMLFDFVTEISYETYMDQQDERKATEFLHQAYKIINPLRPRDYPLNNMPPEVIEEPAKKDMTKAILKRPKS